MRLIRYLTVVVVVALLLLVTIGYRLLTSPLPITQPSLVQVLPGDHFEQVVQRLEGQGDLGNGWRRQGRQLALKAYARVSGLARHLQVGEYPVAPNSNLLNVLENLRQSEVLQRSFVLVDGQNFRQIRDAMLQLPSLKHKLPSLTDEQVAQQLGLSKTSPEGWLAPDTYFYTLGSSDMDILRRAYARQKQVLDRLWQQRDKKLPYQSAFEALVMASIVEKETAVRSEMPTIAGVFISRLKKGMKLQTDPTVIYAMGDRYKGRIRYRDLRLKSPYNTYVNYGLPPGPIAMPGKLAISAALHPKVTGALYFVAKGDGTHKFSSTLAKHNAAVRRYQLNRRSNYRSTPEAAKEETQ